METSKIEEKTIWCNSVDEAESMWRIYSNDGWTIKSCAKVKFNWKKFEYGVRFTIYKDPSEKQPPTIFEVAYAAANMINTLKESQALKEGILRRAKKARELAQSKTTNTTP